MSKPHLFVISGPSGCGKSTLIQRLLEDPRFRLAVSATTRAPRDGEQDGVDYHFVDGDTFDGYIQGGELLEWAAVHTAHYGTPRSEADPRREDEVILLDIDSEGWKSIKKLGLPAVGIFIAPPSMDALEARLRGRGTETEQSLQVRLKNAATEMAATTLALYDHVVTNHVVDESTEALRDIIARTGPSPAADPTPHTKTSQ